MKKIRDWRTPTKHTFKMPANINIFVAAGAVVGAGVGAAAGFGLSRVARRKAAVPGTPKVEELPDDDDDARQPGTPAAGTPKALPSPSPTKAGKHTVFDTASHYLTTNSEFYTPLDRFYNMLQFKEEREAFGEIVVAVDGLMGMEILLNARSPVTAAKIPSVAQRARNKAKQAFAAIVEFSHEQRPSQTKRSTMQELADSMLKIMDEIITAMHQTIAAAPITERN